MSRREAWLSAGAVFALALAVRAVAAATLSFAVPEDTAYYGTVARNLVEGRGLVTDALWSYQTPPLEVPRAAFEVWMPLPSLLAAVPIALAGAANWFRAAQLLSVVVGAIGAALAWRLGADVAAELRLPVGRARTLAVGTGVVTCFLGPLVVYGALPDSTGLFAALSLAACLLMTRIEARTPEGGRPAEGGGLDERPAEGSRTSAEGRQPQRGRPFENGRPFERPADGAGPADGVHPAEGGRPLGRTRRLLGSLLDRRLIALGLLIGFAGLTRSEAVWLGLAWLVVAWRWTSTSTGGTPAAGSGPAAISGTPAGRPSRLERLRLIAVPAAVAVAVFAPWAVRDWLVFGSPLPGQTVANALSVNPTDIFAYQDQPTLAHYLAQGPAALIGMRVTGTLHNLFDVLVVPGFPIGLFGLLLLPRCARLRALRPLVLVAVMTFLVTSLVFPVSTMWGTFLHSAGAIYVLLIVSCLIALDSLVALVGRLRHWWRPVAWLGPAFATAVVLPLMFVSVAALDRSADDTRAGFDALPAALERAGVPLTGSSPVITDNPIWLAETARVTALALPEESPDVVLALARRFGADLLVVVHGDGDGEWPGILKDGGSGAQCFREVPLTDNSGKPPVEGSPLFRFRAFRIVCS